MIMMKRNVTDPSGSTRNFADNVGKDDIVVVGVGDDLAPLRVLAQAHVVAQERMRNTATVRIFATFEQETGRHFFTHPVTPDLVELKPVAKALVNKTNQKITQI